MAREADLEALEVILQPPNKEELVAFREQARRARRFCDENGLLLVGECAGVGDSLMWMSGVDVVVRRGWYESTDFWSPSLYRRFLFDPLHKEVQIGHQAGVKVSYVMNSGALPLLPQFKELGFDILTNIDPQAPKTDLREMKAQIGDRICLCGGVNNTHVLEEGSVEEVERAVQNAISALAPDSGFILAPGDAVGYLPGTNQGIVERNVRAMIETWKRMAQPSF